MVGMFGVISTLNFRYNILIISRIFNKTSWVRSRVLCMGGIVSEHSTGGHQSIIDTNTINIAKIHTNEIKGETLTWIPFTDMDWL